MDFRKIISTRLLGCFLFFCSQFVCVNQSFADACYEQVKNTQVRSYIQNEAKNYSSQMKSFLARRGIELNKVFMKYDLRPERSNGGDLGLEAILQIYGQTTDGRILEIFTSHPDSGKRRSGIPIFILPGYNTTRNAYGEITSRQCGIYAVDAWLGGSGIRNRSTLLKVPDSGNSIIESWYATGIGN